MGKVISPETQIAIERLSSMVNRSDYHYKTGGYPELKPDILLVIEEIQRRDTHGPKPKQQGQKKSPQSDFVAPDGGE
jgi:hypothetical protein